MNQVRKTLVGLELIPSPINDVDLYCPAKGIHISINNKAKLLAADRRRIDEAINNTHPVVFMVINNKDMPLDIKPLLTDNVMGVLINISIQHLNEQFIQYLINKPTLTAVEQNNITVLNKRKAKPATPKESVLAQYTNTEASFYKYCREVAKSKLEFSKAKELWPTYMQPFTTKQSFIEYTEALKSNKDETHNTLTTINDYKQYVINTPINEISKKHIRKTFSSLSDELTYINLVGVEFKNKLKEIKLVAKQQVVVEESDEDEDDLIIDE